MPRQMPGSNDIGGKASWRPGLDEPALMAVPPKRVVMVADSAPAMIAANIHLIRAMRARGHQLFCFALQEARGFRALQALGITPHALPATRQVKHDARALSLALAGLSPHRVVALSWSSAGLAISAGVRAGVDRIVAAFPETSLVFTPGYIDDRSRRACAALLSQCHAAIIPGFARDPVAEGRSTLSPALEPLFVAGPGVDLTRTKHMPLAPLNKGVVFLAIAYPGSEAGIAAYCESARRLRARSENAIHLVVSPPDATPSGDLLRLMKAHRGEVRYLGPRQDFDRLLARAHVLVFPDQTPPIPQEFGLGLAIGRPIIAADAPARRLAVEDGRNGQRVPPGDADALAAAVLSLLRRPDLIPAYARQSRIVAARHFDIVRIVEAQLTALQL